MFHPSQKVTGLGLLCLARICACCLAAVPATAVADTPLVLDAVLRDKCLTILRAGLGSSEFWPSMHAAEGLSAAGLGQEVRQALAGRVAGESDDQHRCGLARELVRAGDRTWVRVLQEVLNSDNPYGHVHACESLYKVYELGDDTALRRAMQDATNAKKAIMAAAALARWGSPAALQRIRSQVGLEDGETARIAAWVLARIGDAQDLPVLRAGVGRFPESLTRAYFEHALAALGDADGRSALVRNLSDPDGAVRVYACEFAPDARAFAAREPLIRLLDDEVLDVRIRAAQALLQLSLPEPLGRAAVIVRDVYPATVENPRYSEGSILALADGSLLFATTEFRGSAADTGRARLIAMKSSDGGRTWSDRRCLQENVGRTNVMSVTLRRLAADQRCDAPVGLFYLVKNSPQDLRVYLRVSQDDAATFGAPILVTDAPGYHVLNNDRVTILKSGRIVVPVASTDDVDRVNHFVCSCFLSSDGGQHWRRGSGRVDYPQRGAMEPEVWEQASGRLGMHLRTQLGHIAVSYSSDAGETWTATESWKVRSPESPATLRRIPSTGDLLLIWNDTFQPGAGHGGRRTPLSAAVSPDEGRTWGAPRQLEADPQHTYAYTSLTFHQGRAVMSYYVSDDTGRISSRFRSVPLGWFYQP